MDVRSVFGWLAEVFEATLRFAIPAFFCVMLIIACIAGYDRYYPNPPDHFTPARAITAVAILVFTLMWLGWRFARFIRSRRG